MTHTTNHDWQRLNELSAIASVNGWNVYVDDDPDIPDVADEQKVMAQFTRWVDDHIEWGFGVGAWYNAATGRWNLLRQDGKYPVLGLRIDHLTGREDAWFWRALVDLDYYLRFPKRLPEPRKEKAS